MSAPRIRPDEPLVALDLVEEATARLLRTASDVRPDQISDASLLPGWTRGHVLAHVSRNAEAVVRVLEGAAEGRHADMYASAEVRDQDIEDGAGRMPEDQAADIKDTAERLAAVARGLPEDAWSFQITHRTGRVFPAARIPWMRLGEVEYHHVDLDLGYGPGDWPAEFVAVEVTTLTDRFAATEDLPPVLLRDAQSGTEYRIGAAAGPPLTAEAPAHDLLAWLSGRADGARLTVHRGGTPVEDPASVLPTLPALA
ncbi:maleylpyruvate isomerase family mycothiol-dependent enzyme [Streptomonospora litoralis]|uniref:Mycothiol-dependent maleylpyruvate isomerase n=1 Tax=Streptomonospora litoralis TaxID=2498135 RepID=A0A4P6PVZ9_9ACTN|nr:maleylpyruvate isomerase family mycothiol-dependent enzyme [Streptomonospora litoralis]QBI52255.1 mycothiol-dependent maleylpyruvate isomerase [Streptomonospora litoralis]